MYSCQPKVLSSFSPQHNNYKPSSTTKPQHSLISGNHSYGAKHRGIEFGFPMRQRPTLVHLKPECTHAIKEGLGMEIVKTHKVSDEIQGQINFIKMILSSIKGGQLCISPYDTAWLALIEEITHDESSKMSSKSNPQFPECLEWIANNQLQDGSWGATYMFSAYDRLINTLACIVALKKWNIDPPKIEKGILFIKENISLLQNENSDHMTIGFEIVFPTLMEMGRKLDMKLPDDSDPFMQDINAKRNLKLAKIPMDVLHKEHTTLHFSLEGIVEGLDWEKLLNLLCDDGSMLYSPAATAYTFMQTNDAKCLRYLSQLVQLFKGGAPYIYPVDMFARNFAVDRLQRLGISRYFPQEINKCVNYVSRYWTKKGIYSISNSPFYNIDDTAMGFRNLRLHGHEISADAFWNFKDGDAFCCFPRQSSESVTAMFNFYRASQLMYPEEIVLEEGKMFAYNFLKERQANKKLVDKWLISKDLPSEVGYALEVPWYASLPRVETIFYIEQYGGQDDTWIGKSLYKMPEVNNNAYLDLAKLDFKICQDKHQMEWEHIIEWYKNNKVEQSDIGERSLLLSYFVAAASIFEVERSVERLAWAKSAILVKMIVAFFTQKEKSFEQRKSFIDNFVNSKWSINQNGNNSYITDDQGLLATLIDTLNQLSAAVHHEHPVRDIRQYSHHLHHVWESWLVSWGKEGVSSQSDAELLALVVTVCSGQNMSTSTLSNPQYKRLVELVNRICLQLHHYHQHKVWKDKEVYGDSDNITTVEIESNMRELIQLVFKKSSDDIDPQIKQTFLAVAKSFYYTSYCAPTIIDAHITKVLFQPVC